MFISKKEYESYQELYKKYQNCVARLIDMETELEETRLKNLELIIECQDLKRKTESIKTYSATIETNTGEVFIYKGIKALSFKEAKDKAHQKLDLSSYRTYWTSIKQEVLI